MHKVFCLTSGGTILPVPMVEAYYSGEKETFELKVDSGESIRATALHFFLMKDGTWRSLKTLNPGDLIVMAGTTESTPRKMKKGTGSGGHNWKFEDKPRYSSGVKTLRVKFKECQVCHNAPYEETHHIDGNHEDHSLSNLLPVCRKCHKRLHVEMSGRKPAPYDKGASPRSAQITFIGNPRIEDTYDIAMPAPDHNYIANGFVVHNSWAFNHSHAVAYGIVSYWCCWFKAHHPVEFAAATLDAEVDPAKQLLVLRELKTEGIDYVPVDPDHSTDRWVPVTRDDGRRVLVGPLTAIKGIGPAKVREILDCRRSEAPLRPALRKQLENASTELDSLFPVKDAIQRLHPDLSAINIVSQPLPIDAVQCGEVHEALVLGVIRKIAPKDENEAVNVMKRGFALTGPTQALGMFFGDDTGEIYCKVNRMDFERLGRPIVERARAGKSLYAIKGTVPRGFRMISVKNVRYLGELDG